MAPPIWADSAVGIMRIAATAPIIESLLSMRLSPSKVIMAATNKCLAQSNKSRTSFEATKNLLALTAAPPLLDGVNLQYAPSIGPKEQIDVASLQTTELDAMENCRVRDRRWAREGRCADCLDRRYRRFWHDSGGHVIVAVIVPHPRVPSRLNMPRLFAIGSASFRSSA